MAGRPGGGAARNAPAARRFEERNARGRGFYQRRGRPRTASRPLGLGRRRGGFYLAVLAETRPRKRSERSCGCVANSSAVAREMMSCSQRL